MMHADGSCIVHILIGLFLVWCALTSIRNKMCKYALLVMGVLLVAYHGMMMYEKMSAKPQLNAKNHPILPGDKLNKMSKLWDNYDYEAAYRMGDRFNKDSQNIQMHNEYAQSA